MLEAPYGLLGGGGGFKNRSLVQDAYVGPRLRDFSSPGTLIGSHETEFFQTEHF